MTVVIRLTLTIDPASLRAYADELHAEILADGERADPVEQIEQELLEGWASELETLHPLTFIRAGVTATAEILRLST